MFFLLFKLLRSERRFDSRFSFAEGLNSSVAVRSVVRVHVIHPSPILTCSVNQPFLLIKQMLAFVIGFQVFGALTDNGN